MSYVHPAVKTRLELVTIIEKEVQEQTEKLQKAYYDLFTAKNQLLCALTEIEKTELGIQGYDLDLLWEVCYNRLFKNGVCNAVYSRTTYLLDRITYKLEKTHYGLSDNTAMAIHILKNSTADDALCEQATLDDRDLYKNVRQNLLDSVFEIWGFDWSELAGAKNE